MEKNQFLQLQYTTLREEIRETKARIFKTLGFGLTVIPAAQVLATTYQIKILTLVLPVLVVISSLLYLAENHALMRCGAYIRDYIETDVKDCVGWEAWLCAPDANRKRSVDKYLYYGALLLFGVYYTASVYLSVRMTMASTPNILIVAGVLSAYVALGIAFGIFFVLQAKTSTTTAVQHCELPMRATK